MKSLLEAKSALAIFQAIKNLKNNGSKVFDKVSNKSDDNDNAPFLGGSISNYSKDLIMTFPTLCDNSLSPSTASMISRANERNIVTMLELLFASAQLTGTDGVSVLSSIYKNVKTDMSLDDFIDITNNIADRASNNAFKINFSEAAVLKEMTEKLKCMNKKSFPVNSFAEKSVNEYTVNNINGRTIVREAIANDHRTPLDDDVDRNLSNKKDLDTAVNTLQRMLLDSEVKKSNEMTPSLIIVNYNAMNQNGTVPGIKSAFIAGAKSRLIPVDSSDIVDRVIAKNKTKVSFLNVTRATTGEINFVRDFLLCVDQAKINSKNAVKKGPAAKMFNALENIAIKNAKNKFKSAGNDASCITTLVINQETVNLLKKQYDFDIERVSNAKMIMQAYNLLGIIIADESIEVVKFLYDGNDMFEQQAYSYLEKETNDNSYKKVINLIGKMNGR